MRLPLLLLLTACIPDPFALPPRDCDERQAWWPDTDQDGQADPGEVYVTCGDPGPGWVDTPPTDTDTDTDSGA